MIRLRISTVKTKMNRKMKVERILLQTRVKMIRLQMSTVKTKMNRKMKVVIIESRKNSVADNVENDSSTDIKSDEEDESKAN